MAVLGASTGMFGAVWAQAELRKVAAALGARVIDREFPLADAEGRLPASGELVGRTTLRQELDGPGARSSCRATRAPMRLIDLREAALSRRSSRRLRSGPEKELAKAKEMQ